MSDHVRLNHAWRAQRRAEGGCIRCVERAKPGRKHCQVCLDAIKEYGRAKYLAENGTMGVCGHPLARSGDSCRKRVPGGKRCLVHRPGFVRRKLPGTLKPDPKLAKCASCFARKDSPLATVTW